MQRINNAVTMTELIDRTNTQHSHFFADNSYEAWGLAYIPLFFNRFAERSFPMFSGGRQIQLEPAYRAAVATHNGTTCESNEEYPVAHPQAGKNRDPPPSVSVGSGTRLFDIPGRLLGFVV